MCIDYKVVVVVGPVQTVQNFVTNRKLWVIFPNITDITQSLRCFITNLRWIVGYVG